MSRDEFWILCVSEMPGTTRATVKVLGSSHVPAKGEKLTILGMFESRRRAQGIRKRCDDAQIIRNWKDGMHIDYSNMHMDPHEPRG